MDQVRRCRECFRLASEIETKTKPCMNSSSTDNKYRLSFTTGGLFWSESIDLVERFLREGDWVSIRSTVVDEDTLHVRTRAAGMRISREIISRLKELSQKELNFFTDASTQEQLWMLWVAVCRHYSFIREFAVEVLRENYLTLRHKVDHKDFDAFFTLKPRCAMRWTSTRVLPLPAPARIIKGPPGCSTACRWGAFRWACTTKF